jgi:hypothetical protein
MGQLFFVVGDHPPSPSIAVGVGQDTPRFGESLPRFAVTFRADLRGDDDVFGLVAAAAALELEDFDALGRAAKRVVRREPTL